MTNSHANSSNHNNNIPGNYNFHTASRDAGAPPRLSGAKSHVFQPPRTPPASASSSLILSRSTTSIISTTTSIVNNSSQNGTRKRRLTDYHEVVETPEASRLADDWERDQYGGRPEDWMPGSPQPFVNTKYHLAGGMDTPGLSASRVEDVTYGEPMFRKSLSDMDEEKYIAGLKVGGADRKDCAALEREANGRGRGQAGQQTTGWSMGAISVVGVVVGKAWEFCKAGATVFTGFRAGGGQAYKVNGSDAVARFEAIENNWETEKQDYSRDRRGHTPVPGGFPEEEFIYDYFSDHQAVNDAAQRPTKRRQVSGGFRDEEIAKNWVVVPTPPPSRPQPREAPPQRPIHGFTPRRSMLPTSRPASRASLGTTPAKRSMLPRGSHAGSPALNPNRGASFAPSRSPASRIPRASGSPMREVRGPTEESPVAKEARRWKAQKRKEEREADESIRRLDAQLKAMIREGKEALGTKIEVLDDEMEDLDQPPRWAY